MKKEEKNSTTVGQEAYKRLLNPDSKQGIIDTQREIDKQYFEQIEECVKKHKGKLGFTGDFFITVISKKERVMENVIRRYFIARESLPTPNYDQTVWRFNQKVGDLQYIWTIPDHNTCQEMFNNPMKVPESEDWLLQMVQMFMTGRLYHATCKQFNIAIDVDSEKPLEEALIKMK